MLTLGGAPGHTVNRDFMTLSIQIREIPEELLHRLDERASLAGIDRADYVRRLIERDVDSAGGSTLAEILAPVHTASTGMSEDDLEALLSEELDAARRERRSNRAQ